MRSLSYALIASLVLVGALTSVSGPAGATSSRLAPDDEPRYVIEPFHPRGSDDARLVKAWRTWQGREHSRYRTVVGHSCECVPEGRIRTDVEGGHVTAVTQLHDDAELERHGYEMDELFRILRSAYESVGSDRVTATYHRGALVTIAIDRKPRRTGPEERYLARLRNTDAAADFAYGIRPFRSSAKDRAVLRRSWQAWRDGGIRSYTTTVRRQAGEGSFPTVRTTVDGPLVSRVEAVDSTDEVKEGYEIERVYQMIRRLYRTAAQVRVRYDDRGVPRFISADPIAEAVDDEFVLRLSLRAS